MKFFSLLFFGGLGLILFTGVTGSVLFFMKELQGQWFLLVTLSVGALLLVTSIVLVGYQNWKKANQKELIRDQN